ncbi:hypothetical protein KEJ50_02365 [Candidatus Bathyarchaeota archaeon]|nr:hypothetical protein [Candidatus Bathyarchaeota archaeon]
MEKNYLTQIELRKLIKSIFLLNLLILLCIWFSLPQKAYAEEIGYYQYNPRSGVWVWISKPWKPTTATTLITIFIKGLPPDYSTEIIIDGKPVGFIQGGEVKRFEVNKKSSHVFQVNKEVKGSLVNYEGLIVETRYICPGNTWNLELVYKDVTELVPIWYWFLVRDDSYHYWDYYLTYEYRTRTITELAEGGHIFEYFIEHELYVMDPYGLKFTGWFKEGSDTILSAKNVVIIKDEANIKERAVFKSWIINGVPVENNIIPLKIDKPIVAIAEYKHEIEYKVNVYSEFGHLSLNKPEGWYVKGEEAIVSIESEISLEGWKGALGGKRVFNGWYSEKGLESKNAVFKFIVEESKNLQAEWVVDESKPIISILALIILIVVILGFMLYKKPKILSKLKAGKSEAEELAKLKDEVEKLRRFIESQFGKPIE